LSSIVCAYSPRSIVWGLVVDLHFAPL